MIIGGFFFFIIVFILYVYMCIFQILLGLFQVHGGSSSRGYVHIRSVFCNFSKWFLFAAKLLLLKSCSLLIDFTAIRCNYTHVHMIISPINVFIDAN